MSIINVRDRKLGADDVAWGLGSYTYTDANGVTKTTPEINASTIPSNATQHILDNLLDITAVGDVVSMVDAVNSMGTTDPATLYLRRGSYTLSVNMNLPANIKLWQENEAIINVPNGITLTINGLISEDRHMKFNLTGTGRVVIANGQDVYPEWWGAKGDGSTDDTAAFDAAMTCWPTVTDINGGTIVLSNKTYIVDTLTNFPYGQRMLGTSKKWSILKSKSGNTVISIDGTTTHSFELGNFSIQGNGGSGHGLYIHGMSWGYYVHDMTIDGCGGKGIYDPDGFSTLYQNIRVDNCGDNAIEGGFGNCCTLQNCYVANVASGKVAYRIYGGAATLIGCNGVDSGETWGLFGQSVAEDGSLNYAYPTLINCNIEAFSSVGIQCRDGSGFNTIGSVSFLSAAGSTSKAVYGEGGPLPMPVWLGLHVQLGAGASWSNGYAIHCHNGPPAIMWSFIQSAPATPTQYYDPTTVDVHAIPQISSKYCGFLTPGLGFNAAAMGDYDGGNYSVVDGSGNMSFHGTATLTLPGGTSPTSLADGAAANNTIYYSTTQSAVVYKDAGGVVHKFY